MTSCYSVSFIVALPSTVHFVLLQEATPEWLSHVATGVFFGGCRELNTCAMVDQLLIFGSQLIPTSWQEILIWWDIQTPTEFPVDAYLYSFNSRDCFPWELKPTHLHHMNGVNVGPRWQRICPDSPGPKPCRWLVQTETWYVQGWSHEELSVHVLTISLQRKRHDHCKHI